MNFPEDYNAASLFKVHPFEYDEIAMNHAAMMDDEVAREMVSQFLHGLMSMLRTKKSGLTDEHGALYAYYTTNLFHHLFARVYSNAEQDLENRDALQRMFDNS